MAILTVEKKMLYCQKCHHEYEENGQRFCVNDGNRLVPVGSSQKNSASPGGVFSTILSDVISFDRKDNNFAREPEFIEAEIKPPSYPSPVKREFLKTGIEETYKLEIESSISKPFSRIINPGDIPSGQAALGDHEKFPMGRPAVSWDKPQVLLEQIVKGRYHITEKFKQNESSITYLAEDKLVAGKKVFVCVLMEEDSDGRNFAEERVSLSHINHPNINRVIDSGSLLEGKYFIVSEFIEGTSLKEILAQTGGFDTARTARIIKQTANALSEAAQNGVLHGNLSPEDIILSVNETGTEQVKITNFSVSSGDTKSKNFWYKSPEQLTGKPISFASDIYSLAIIAYQMLTGRLPFSAAAAGEHLRLRREGMTLHPSNFRLDVPFAADEILKKALSFKPSDRFSKARDFGDVLFIALTAAPENKERKENIETQNIAFGNDLFVEDQDDLLSVSGLYENEPDTEPLTEILALNDDIRIAAASPAVNLFDKSETVREDKAQIEETTIPEEPAWQKRSTDPMKTVGRNWTVLAILGITLLFAGLWGIRAYFLNHPDEPQSAITQNPIQNEQPVGSEIPQNPALIQENPPVVEESEIPPPPRTIEVPANSVYFENSKENLTKELLKNYRGFSLYYPNNWKKNNPDNKFIDVSLDAPNGAPVEQIMISPYESKGTFLKDKELFPKLVEKSNKDLAKDLDEKLEVVSEGETTIQNGRWKAYEVKFRAEGSIDGEKTTVWGRRLWIPVQRPGAGSGFIITMLATSFSNDVKSVEDVGVKGRLAEILYTFEPDTNF